MLERSNLPVRYIFDSDGFLIDTEDLSVIIIGQVAGSMGRVENFDVAPYIKAGGKYITRIAHDLGIGHLTTVFRDTVHNEIEAQIRQKGQDIVMPGIPSLVEDLRGMGVQLGVGSQTKTKSTRERLEIAGLAGNFEFIAGSDQVKDGKPHPALFNLVARKLGGNARMFGVIGDSDTDIIAGRRAVMMTVQVSPKPYEGPVTYRPHIQVRDATQLSAQELVEVVRSRY